MILHRYEKHMTYTHYLKGVAEKVAIVRKCLLFYDGLFSR